MAKKKTARTTETAPLKWQEAQNLLKCLKADAGGGGGAAQCETLLLLALGFYTGLRISDILRLKWEDVLGKKEFVVQEKKTGKTRKIQVNPALKEAIDFCSGRICPAKGKKAAERVTPEGYIFTSKKGPAIGQPLTVVGANLRIKAVFKEYGIATQNASSHCLRKTFARRVYEQNQQSEAALILLSQILNHDGPATTRRYIGLTSEVVAEAYLNL